jgi:N-acetylglucosaminyldiphosphoundecaprenol N-acetyl-beta-D-mannosaminyltransferase
MMASILGVKAEASSYSEVVERCTAWAATGESRAVLFIGMHSVMEAYDRPAFRTDLNAGDICNPDGMPIVWLLRMQGHRDASRVYGPDATLALMGAAQELGIPVGFYGGNESTLVRLVAEVKLKFPNVQIVYQESPPFRNLSEEEDEVVVRQMTESGARLLFVGLGCPKQETWVVVHRGRVPAVMLAVGAAFDFIAKTKPQAPRWMMRIGLEWAFRLVTEPRRLAGRYLKNIPRFVYLLVRQWVTKEDLIKVN